MRAALIRQFRETPVVETVADPDCPEHGAIVEVRACGVCRSDHHAWTGQDPDVRLPHVMGHEIAGVVSEVGRGCRGIRVGDRVVAPFILPCGTCADCRGGRSTACETQDVMGFTSWGGFAQYVAVPNASTNLVPLPDQVDFLSAAGMGCRVTTAWRALTDRAVLQPGEWVAVHGCGGVGLSVIMIARALGARIVAIDVSQGALGKATELGADIALDGNSVADVGAAVRDATGGGADVAIDALGITATFENALRSLRKLGRYVQVGMPVGSHAMVPLPLLELIYARQLTMHGMRGLGAAEFAPLLALAASGRINLPALVTRRIALAEVGGVLKEMSGSQQKPGVTVIDTFA